VLFRIGQQKGAHRGENAYKLETYDATANDTKLPYLRKIPFSDYFMFRPRHDVLGDAKIVDKPAGG